MPMKTLLAVIILLLSCSLAGAEMYQWIGDDGSVTYKDTPPPATGKRKKVRVYNDSDVAPAPAHQPEPGSRSATKGGAPASPAVQAAAPGKGRFKGTVEIYVTSWCGYCKQALSYMDNRGIPYVAYDVEKDRAAGQRHRELGGRGVPLIIIGSNRMSGFSPQVLENYLNNSGQ